MYSNAQGDNLIPALFPDSILMLLKRLSLVLQTLWILGIDMQMLCMRRSIEFDSNGCRCDDVQIFQAVIRTKSMHQDYIAFLLIRHLLVFAKDFFKRPRMSI